MTAIDRIRDQLARAQEGDAWCGPSVREVVEDVSAADALRRVPGVSHSICEIVLHLATWQEAVAERLSGRAITEPAGGDLAIGRSSFCRVMDAGCAAGRVLSFSDIGPRVA